MGSVTTGEAVHVYSSGLRQRIHTEDISWQSSPLTQVANDKCFMLCLSIWKCTVLLLYFFGRKIHNCQNKVLLKNVFLRFFKIMVHFWHLEPDPATHPMNDEQCRSGSDSEVLPTTSRLLLTKNSHMLWYKTVYFFSFLHLIFENENKPYIFLPHYTYLMCWHNWPHYKIPIYEIFWVFVTLIRQ